MGYDLILSVLRILLVVLGVLTALWGVYDMFGDGQQNSMGVKKIIGGVAFAIVSALVIQWAITEVGKAESAAGIEGAKVYLQSWMGRW